MNRPFSVLFDIKGILIFSVCFVVSGLFTSQVSALESSCGPEFVQELQDQFLCTNSVKLGGCVSLANDTNGGVQAPEASSAKGSREALDKLSEVQQKEKSLERRLKDLNEEHAQLQAQLIKTSVSTVEPRTEQAIAAARSEVIRIKFAIDNNRKRALTASNELADLLHEYAKVEGAKEKPVLEPPNELIVLDTETAKVLMQKQILLIERGSPKAIAALDRKLTDIKAERAEQFRAIVAPVKTKVSRRNQFNMAQGVVGMEYGKAVGRAIQNIACASRLKDLNKEIFNYVEVDNNCELWITDEQFERFVSMFQADQLEALKKHPRLCKAYQEHLSYLRSPKVIMKGDPKCLVDSGMRYEATIEVNGREYTHAFEMADDGSVLVRGAFAPGQYPGYANSDIATRAKTFAIRFDNQMQGGVISTHTTGFGLASASMMNVATFKRQHFIYKKYSVAPTKEEMRVGATDDFLDRKMVTSIGEQIEAIQSYSPAVFKICSEKKQAVGGPAVGRIGAPATVQGRR